MAEKDIPPAELSLKYMAWNIKEISENVKKLTEASLAFMNTYTNTCNETKDKLEKLYGAAASDMRQGKLPF